LNPKYSVIIPVYNRPQEVEELIQSLALQGYRDLEVLVIDDGSTDRCDAVVDRFRDRLAIQYYFKPNSGPGPTRNFGFEHSRGAYFVMFDSDCLLPDTYFLAVEAALGKEKLDAWGGPDRPMKEFSVLQRAMGYTMSSFLTTGGIRGGKRHLGWFQPRSFNMGISRKVFERTGGFRFDRHAEDIELSVRMRKEGFRIGLIPDAFVYHKRRTNFSQFYRQVAAFGKGRALVGVHHPEEVKLTHWMPTLFVLAVMSLPILYFIAPVLSAVLLPLLLLYFLALFFHSLITNRNLAVAILSIPSAAIQLWGYGTGFFKEWLKSYTT